MTSVAESKINTGVPSEKPEDVAIEKASGASRTTKIVIAQVIALAVFAVVWSILRSRRSEV